MEAAWSGGNGAAIGVQAPAASTSNTSAPEAPYGPAATHEPTAPHEALKRSSPGSAGAPAGNGAMREVQPPPGEGVDESLAVVRRVKIRTDLDAPAGCGAREAERLGADVGVGRRGGRQREWATVLHSPPESSAANGIRALEGVVSYAPVAMHEPTAGHERASRIGIGAVVVGRARYLGRAPDAVRQRVREEHVLAVGHVTAHGHAGTRCCAVVGVHVRIRVGVGVARDGRGGAGPRRAGRARRHRRWPPPDRGPEGNPADDGERRTRTRATPHLSKIVCFALDRPLPSRFVASPPKRRPSSREVAAHVNPPGLEVRGIPVRICAALIPAPRRGMPDWTVLLRPAARRARSSAGAGCARRRSGRGPCECGG